LISDEDLIKDKRIIEESEKMKKKLEKRMIRNFSKAISS
jgi:hypothetical protein